MPAGSLLTTPPVFTVWLHGCENAPLPICSPEGLRLFYGFGLVLSPVGLSAQSRLTSELLRFL